MKYIKLFEDKKEYDEIIDKFKICFQELIDKGFKVIIRGGDWNQAYFGKENIVNIDDVKFKFLDHITYGFKIFISKDSMSDFNIKDIKDDLLIAESYMKQEFKLNIFQINVQNNLYKSIEYLPVDYDVDHINIYFAKN
jgi:hypothetical protein